MKIFPNPATDYMNISLNSNVAEPTEITIYDQRGRKVYISKCNYDGVSPIATNMSALSSGVYLISVKNSHYWSTKSPCIAK